MIKSAIMTITDKIITISIHKENLNVKAIPTIVIAASRTNGKVSKALSATTVANVSLIG